MSNEIIKIGYKWIDITAIIAISDISVVVDLPPANYGVFYIWMKFHDKEIEFFGTREEVEEQHNQLLNEWKEYKLTKGE